MTPGAGRRKNAAGAALPGTFNRKKRFLPMADDEVSFVRALSRREGWQDLARARLAPLAEGMSDAAVFRVSEGERPARYLKTARGPAAAALREEIARTRWLAQHRVRVPDILRADDRADRVVMLTAAVAGVAADVSPLPADQLADALARGLKALHALPVAECPFDETLKVRLARAAAAVAAGEVYADEFAPRNANVVPEALLARLRREQPAEDIVVVHGDATLSNIFVGGDGSIGFIDCGNAGRGDRYVDLAVLMADIGDTLGPQAAARFAQKYGASGLDGAKARYFADLYELF